MTATKYMMTVLSDSQQNYWEPCNAKTLAGAKREATRKMSGYVGEEICVGIDWDAADVEKVAVRPILRDMDYSHWSAY